MSLVFDSSIECIICVWSQEKFSVSSLLHYVKRQAGGKSRKRLRARVQSFFGRRLCKRTHRSCGARYWHHGASIGCNQIYMRERTHTHTRARGCDTYTFIALIILLGSGFDIILPPLQRGLLRCLHSVARRRREYVRASLI